MAFHLLVLRAIIRAEVLMRLRKSSTAVLFVLLCIAAYMWIPAPDTGRAVMQIKDQRVLYNSAALGTATATLCSLLLGLFGYYMISSSIRNDVQSRTGFIISATRFFSQRWRPDSWWLAWECSWFAEKVRCNRTSSHGTTC